LGAGNSTTPVETADLTDLKSYPIPEGFGPMDQKESFLKMLQTEPNWYAYSKESPKNTNDIKDLWNRVGPITKSVTVDLEGEKIAVKSPMEDLVYKSKTGSHYSMKKLAYNNIAFFDVDLLAFIVTKQYWYGDREAFKRVGNYFVKNFDGKTIQDVGVRNCFNHSGFARAVHYVNKGHKGYTIGTVYGVYEGRTERAQPIGFGRTIVFGGDYSLTQAFYNSRFNPPSRGQGWQFYS